MERLILLRHGEAKPRGREQHDLDRELTDAGRAAAAQAGRVLAEAGLVPDVVIVSPATRTRQTWAAARGAWPALPPSREDKALYEETPARLFRLAEAAGRACVMLVAHNPGLEALAADLSLSDPRLARGFPPGTAAVLEREGEDWRLALFHTPGGGAG